MTVKNRLARSFANVNADIISIGVESLVDFLHDVLLYHIYSLFLMIGKVTIGGDVTLQIVVFS